MGVSSHDTPRFLAVLVASLLIGAGIAAGQQVILDPNGDPVADFNNLLIVNSGGPVELPTADLNMRGNRLYGDGEVEVGDGFDIVDGGAGATPNVSLYNAQESYRTSIYADGGMLSLAVDGTSAINAHSNQDVTVPNGRFGVGTNSPREEAHLADNRPRVWLDDNDDEVHWWVGSYSDQFRIVPYNTSTGQMWGKSFRINDNGNVEIDQRVDIQNGNLDLNGNTILGVGGTQCAADEALLGDGTCGSTGAGGDPWVNESGDTMSGNLDMGGNAISSVGAVGGSAFDGQSNVRFEWGKYTHGCGGGTDTVSFSTGFSSAPVVLCTVPLQGGDELLGVRCGNIGTSSFDMKCCEIEDSGTGSCDSHSSNDVSWMAVGPS